MITTAIALGLAAVYFTLTGGADIGKWLFAAGLAIAAMKVFP